MLFPQGPSVIFQNSNQLALLGDIAYSWPQLALILTILNDKTSTRPYIRVKSSIISSNCLFFHFTGYFILKVFWVKFIKALFLLYNSMSFENTYSMWPPLWSISRSVPSSPLMSLCEVNLFLLSPWQPLIGFPVSFSECHSNTVIQYMAFWVWLLSLTIMPLRFNRVFARINSLFLFIV